MSLGGLAALTESQREWVQVQKLSMMMYPIVKPDADFHRPESLEELCFYIADHRITKFFERMNIVLAIILLAISHFGETEEFTAGKNATSCFCSIFFSLLTIMKVIGYRELHFDSWDNVIDILLLVMFEDLLIYDIFSGTSCTLSLILYSHTLL